MTKRDKAEIKEAVKILASKLPKAKPGSEDHRALLNAIMILSKIVRFA